MEAESMENQAVDECIEPGIVRAQKSVDDRLKRSDFADSAENIAAHNAMPTALAKRDAVATGSG
jgi:hypothetical protein